MTRPEALGSAQHCGPSLVMVALTFTLLFLARMVGAGPLIAALAALLAFSLVLHAASFLLPATRVLGFAWMIGVGAVPPKLK